MRLPSPGRPALRPPGRPKPGDVTSGLVTGLFSIPEGTAYASIAGFDPVAGLFSGVVPAIVGSLTARGGRLIVAGAQPSFVRLAGRTGLAGALGPDGVVPADPVLDAALEEAVARGERWLTGRRTAAD
ncbi:SulP family inorganic anion transporter [Kitasatospora cineracea]|uniref:Sulfate permease family protein n=1 Tax=Kitasatospora cineracea TaxID=88074 RepID=A0A8G1UIM0_9ACTN|nr:SulP family inorganic anion transporter [Kitasatospora cineracea]ROR43709.1 sulfate permease family protein [Kitasatospora cineracea]